MSKKEKKVHPYIPNSVPEVKAKMLEEIGVKNIEELYGDIPEGLRFKGEMNLPEALPSEHDLKRHVEKFLQEIRHARKISVFWVEDAGSIMFLLSVMKSTSVRNF